MLRDTLVEITKSQKNNIQPKPGIIPREALANISLQTPQAIIISGIRRCGKSTLLRQIMNQTGARCYFNFEDQRVMEFNVNDFENLTSALEEVYGPCEIHFFDEIQNVPGWERFIRKSQDEGKRFVITGSNASLLSKELGTKLTGRHLTYELFPFSFKEYLESKNKKPSAESFEGYMKEGGFPEYLNTNNIDTLQELLLDLITRDIVVRHGLREEKIIQQMAIYLISNTGKQFSYNSLAKQFSLGSTNTAISYVSYFEDSYILFTIPRFDYSLKKQQISPRKVYSIDPALSAANSASFSKDKGRAFENIIFLHLRRKNKEIFYFKDRGECDFIVKQKEVITQAIQVCYQLTEENKEREITGLKEAMAALKIKDGIILTNNQEEQIDGIRAIPAWKWLAKE
ncbi:MAG: ATP-binding protein [Nanoarchaeota archaeon]